MTRVAKVSAATRQLMEKKAADIEKNPKYLPSINIGKIEPNYYCRGWNEKRKKYCGARAGQGTKHLGFGRCKQHGGNVPIKHGRYSAVAKSQSLKEHLDRITLEDEENRLDLLPEADMIRALASDFIARYDEIVQALLAWNEEAEEEERKAQVQPIPSLHEASKLLVRVSEVVDKIQKHRNRDAIPRKEFFRLQRLQGDVVAEKARQILGPVVGEKKVSEFIAAVRDGWLDLAVMEE